MRKLLFIILLGVQVAQAQNLGFNGSGMFENYDADVEQYLVDLNAPFTIRFPGGSISKFHDPYNVKRGWGLSESNIKQWFETTGFDEDGNGLEKWLRKAEEQPAHSYLDDLIALQKKFPNMQVLWVLNVLNSTPEANMQAIRYLMSNGVNIVGVEAGNEVYGKYASFSEYIPDFEPVFAMIRKEYPKIKLGLIVGANLGRNDIVRWNDAMAGYKGDFDAVIPHYYYTARELGEAYDMIPLRNEFDPAKSNDDLCRAYDKAATLLLEENDLLGDGCRYLQQKFPGKEIWITEWNTKPSEMLNNTILNGQWQFSQLIEISKMAEYLIIHNGVGPDKYGMISKSNKYDSEPNEMIRRMGYFAYKLASEARDAKPMSAQNIPNLSKSAKGTYKYYFTNTGEAYTADFHIPAGAAIKIHAVAGKHLYSGCGTTGYMGKGSVKSYEVKGINRSDFNNTIPAYSFGYVEVEVR